MSKKTIKIAVTGGSGQIAYSLLFRIASGELFGKDQPITLHVLEIPHGLESLKGVVMEIEDCAFPLVQEIKIGTDPKEIFSEVNYAILVGSKPRGPGMERKDLLDANGKIFQEQGKALNQVAAKDVLVFVVGNPCNTNCLIAMHNAPDIPRRQFCAMTRLDQNRAEAQIAKKAGVLLSQIENMIIWGNHSATQVPDICNAKVDNKPLRDVITDKEWLENTFFETVQKRGAAIIKARGKSSAASAANAIIDGIHSYLKGSNRLFSSCIDATGNPYGIEEDLCFSFPCRWVSKNQIEIAKDFSFDDFLEKKMRLTEKELIEERDLVTSLL